MSSASRSAAEIERLTASVRARWLTGAPADEIALRWDAVDTAARRCAAVGEVPWSGADYRADVLAHAARVCARAALRTAIRFARRGHIDALIYAGKAIGFAAATGHDWTGRALTVIRAARDMP